VNEALSR